MSLSPIEQKKWDAMTEALTEAEPLLKAYATLLHCHAGQMDALGVPSGSVTFQRHMTLQAHQTVEGALGRKPAPASPVRLLGRKPASPVRLPGRPYAQGGPR